MINKLLGDYDDTDLLFYAEKNLAIFKTEILSSDMVGSSFLGVNPGFKYCLLPSDMFMGQPMGCRATQEYFSQSSKDLYESINSNIIGKIFKNRRLGVIYGSPLDKFKGQTDFTSLTSHPRFDLYKETFSPQKDMYETLMTLKFPCDDLLLLSLIAHNFTLQINNKELIELSIKQKKELLEMFK